MEGKIKSEEQIQGQIALFNYFSFKVESRQFWYIDEQSCDDCH